MVSIAANPASGGMNAIRAQSCSADCSHNLWSAASVKQACEEARACIERVVQIAHFWTRHRETPLPPAASTGRSTRYRIRLSESLPSRLIKELNWT